MSTKSYSTQAVSQETSHDLSTFLADTYILYLKTQNFHWNIVDSRFISLHKLFEEQYKDLADAIDTIAERIRALKVRAPATMKEFLELTQLEEPHTHLSGDEMIKELAQDNQTISKTLTEMIDEATKRNDQGSSDLMINRLRAHDKAAWMLRSHLKH